MTDASAKCFIDPAWNQREPGEVVCDRNGYVVIATGDGAQMAVPTAEIVHELTWGDPEKVRYMAASIIESYDYLVHHPNKDEAWRRIKVLREALRIRRQ